MQKNSLKKEELCQEVCIISEAYQITGEHQENQEDQNIKDLLEKTRGGAKGSTLPEDMRLRPCGSFTEGGYPPFKS